MASTDVKGLDRRWAESAAQRVLPDIGMRTFSRARVDPDSDEAEVMAAALIDAFNAGAREWDTEFQARLIEAGFDVKLRPGRQRGRPPLQTAEGRIHWQLPDEIAAPSGAGQGRLAQSLARRTSSTPATVARMLALLIAAAVVVAVVAVLLLSGVAQVVALVACALWLGVLALAHLRAQPAARATGGR